MKRILVIDDREDIRSIVAATLVLAGYAVRGASDGREGIVMVLEERPDLILCDINMPGMDGYRTLEAIRKCPQTADLPPVVDIVHFPGSAFIDQKQIVVPVAGRYASTRIGGGRAVKLDPAALRRSRAAAARDPEAGRPFQRRGKKIAFQQGRGKRHPGAEA